MSGNPSGGTACRSRTHHPRRWEIFEALPREIRDELHRARTNLCCGCVANKLRRSIRSHGGDEAAAIAHVVNDLARQRRLQKERHGREVGYWYEPEGAGP